MQDEEQLPMQWHARVRRHHHGLEPGVACRHQPPIPAVATVVTSSMSDLPFFELCY